MYRTWKMFVIPIILLTLMVSFHPVMAKHEQECKAPFTTMFVYTFPPQKECMLLTHPSGKALEKANDANERWNAGMEAGQKMALIFNSTDDLKCPSKNKDFCDGWKTTAYQNFNLTEYNSRKLAAQGIGFTSWSCPSGHTRSFCTGFNNRINNYRGHQSDQKSVGFG